MAKVAHLTSVHPVNDLRIFHKECQTLARAGYEVVLIVPHNQDEFLNGVKIRALLKPNNRWRRFTRLVWTLYRTALSEQAQIYHFHDPELIPVGLGLHLLGKKVIYDIHEDVPRHIRLSRDYLPLWLRQPLGWLIERIENFACRRFTALITVTPTIGERFQRMNPRTIVINNYPILDEMASSLKTPWPKRSPTVAYVGGISLERGLKEMVEAMAHLPDHLEVRLKLAGHISPPQHRDSVAHLPGWQWVDELGFVGREEVAKLLSIVSAGLVVLHPEPSYLVSHPVKMFEYMSAGVPVIASDFPLWRNIIETAGCGLLVDPLDPEAIAAAIEYILTHPTEAEAMGRRGRQAIEQHYNWQIEQAKLLQLYADLIGVPEM